MGRSPVQSRPEAPFCSACFVENLTSLPQGKYNEPFLEHHSWLRLVCGSELSGVQKAKVIGVVMAEDCGYDLGLEPMDSGVHQKLIKKCGLKLSKKLSRQSDRSFFLDLDTITFDDALKPLSLTRNIGQYEGVDISVQNGRYGPYMTHGTDSRTLTSEDQLFTITLEEAIEIYKQPKVRRRGVAKPPLKELWANPATGRNSIIKDGRFDM